MRQFKICLWALCLSGASSFAMEKLNDEQEYYLGRSVSAHILTSNPNIEHEFNTYLTSLVRWMASFSPRPATFIGYKVSLIDSPFPTALSAPGGYIFLSKKMLEKIETEDQLAGVLAHELAHIIARHGEKAILQKMRQDQRVAQKKQKVADRKQMVDAKAQQAKEMSQGMQKRAEKVKKMGAFLNQISGGQRGQELIERGEELSERGAEIEKNVDVRRDEIKARLDDVSSYIDSVSGFYGEIMRNGFSKKQEHQADEIAVYLMAVSGYDARELAELLAKEKPSVDKVVGQWQSTHPLDADRVERIRKKAAPWEYLGSKEARNKRYLKLKAQVLGN